MKATQDKLRSRVTTRLTFIVIIVFVLAQVVWWIIFQERYISNVTTATIAQWQQEAVLANTLFMDTPDNSNLRSDLQALYPHLRFDPQDEVFVVDNNAVNAFMRKQDGYVRMFAYEGPVFVIVVMFGLYIIALNLRAERELKRRQQNFLSAITHEFKTPMSTLRLLIETALFRPLSAEKQKDYLKRMEAELSRLEQTSEQVLASARLEQQDSAPILEPLELNSVVQGIVGGARAGLEARGASLEVVYSPVALPVSLDKHAFSVVMNNLLDNAVKYSPAFPKPVRVVLASQGDLVFVHVEDQGIGINEKEKHHIFTRFYRVGSEMTRESKGVGLGLHLVKSITEAMNGWVRVEANTPQGSRFTVVLPRRVSLASELEARPVGVSGS